MLCFNHQLFSAIVRHVLSLTKFDSQLSITVQHTPCSLFKDAPTTETHVTGIETDVLTVQITN